MAKLKGGRVVQLQRRLAHRLRNFTATMAQAAAPQAGEAVKNLASIGIGVVRALGGGDDARPGLEVAVAGKRHPVGA